MARSKLFSPTRGLEYVVDHFDDSFYIHTNLDAFNFRLVKTPVTKTKKENWVEEIPHRSDIFFEYFDIFRDYLMVTEMKDGISQLLVMLWKGKGYFINFLGLLPVLNRN